MSRRFPGDTSTFSKAPNQWAANAPRFIEWGRAGHVFSTDGREFIDWTAALAAVSLGYRDPNVTAAVKQRVDEGAVFGTPHRLEHEYADLIGEILPWSDYGIRYGKNGSDATEGAIRAARAITGRDNIISLGYHGWLTTCPNKNGIPIVSQGLVDERWDESHIGAACLIVEPETLSDDELVTMRKWCDATGTLLVFDEILTGFRTPTYWYSTYRGITPDLITAGKAIANGIPLSFVAGKADIMEAFGGAIGFSFTYAGDTMGLAAAIATLRKYQREPVIDRLWDIGHRIKEAWDKSERRTLLEMSLSGQPSRLVVRYPSLAHRTLFSQEMVHRGILWSVGATPMYAHSDTDVERTIAAINESFDVVASVRDDPMRLVNGPAVSLPFRQMVTA